MTDPLFHLAAAVVAFGCFWAADKLFAISLKGKCDD
jgi:peptide methionine sulfoxide reductase MsrA